MKILIYIPLDATTTLLDTGFSIEEIENMYNPGHLFDKVVVLSEKDKVENYGTLYFVKEKVENFPRIIYENRPVAIRANAGFYCSDIAVACKVRGIPLMISVHDPHSENISLSIKYADKIAYISNKVKKAIQEKTDISENKLMYLPRYIDLDLFKKRNDKKKFRELEKKYGTGKHVLHVGRKTEAKNLETTIRAFRYLPEEYTLIMLGLGDTKPYQKIVDDEHLRERIFFGDGIPHNELVEYYSWCDCMCTPSRWEGFGLVFIEAAACECAIVTSDIAPMNEYLSNGESAILVREFGNPKIIAEGIKKACSKTVEIENMRKNARQVAEKFSKKNADYIECENYNRLIRDGVDERAEEKLIEEYRKIKRDIIIYGAGANGKRFYDKLKQYERSPLFFVDQSEKKQGTVIEDTLIRSYEDMEKYHENTIVIVTPYCGKEDIISRLKEDQFEYMEMNWALLLLENDEVKYEKDW